MITPDDLRAAQYVIYTSGAAQRFRDALTSPRGGRKPAFNQELFLLGMFLSVLVYARSHIRLIHRVLTQEIPLDEQIALGIRRPASRDGRTPAWVITETDLQNVSRSLHRALAHLPGAAPDEVLDNPAEVLRRACTLHGVTDTVTDPTLIDRPAGAAEWAIDETGLWASQRSPRNLEKKSQPVTEGDEEEVPPPTLDVEIATEDSGPSTADRRSRTRQDAGFGVKTSKNGSRTWFYGYSLHAIVRVPTQRADGTLSEPPLAERIRLTPAGQDHVDTSLSLIDNLLARGKKIGYLLGDRHYSYKRTDRWLFELIKRNISQVVDLREDDHAFREWDGMLFLGGHAHCPQTPPDLADIRKPPPSAKEDEWDAFHARIDEREKYACERTQPLNAQGESRWRCPARAGKCGCPLVPGSGSAAQQLGLPIIPVTPAHAPKICTQDSVGLRVTNDEQAKRIKLSQDHYWGTRKQVALFKRRTFVEGWFGTLKGDSSANKNRGSSLYTGLVHASIEAAVFTAVANIINLRAWHRETGGAEGHPLVPSDEPFYGFTYNTREQFEDTLDIRPETDAA